MIIGIKFQLEGAGKKIKGYIAHTREASVAREPFFFCFLSLCRWKAITLLSCVAATRYGSLSRSSTPVRQYKKNIYNNVEYYITCFKLKELSFFLYIWPGFLFFIIYGITSPARTLLLRRRWIIKYKDGLPLELVYIYLPVGRSTNFVISIFFIASFNSRLFVRVPPRGTFCVYRVSNNSSSALFIY